MNKILRSYISWGLLISFLLTAVFLTNFLFNLDLPMHFFATVERIGLSHSDEGHAVLTIKHLLDVFKGSSSSSFWEVPIFYGFKNSLLFSEPFYFQAILVLPFYFLAGSVVTAYHIAAYITISLSFFCMFLFAHFLTKRFLPSILAAIIFVYNPFIFARFPEHITYFSLMWIPLIFLSLEKFLVERKNRFCFFVFLFLSLNVLTVMTFNVMLMIILPIYLIVRAIQTKTPFKSFLNKGTVLGILLCLTVTAIVGLPFLNFYAQNPIGRTLAETSYYSAALTDLFVASGNNLLYGDSRLFLHTLFPDFILVVPELTEHNLFAGIVPILLLIFSLWFLPKAKVKGFYFLCLILMFFMILLSFGPQIHITDDLQIPSPYLLLYKIDPFLRFLRAASRFAIFYFFFLSIICAFVLDFFWKKLSKKKALIVSFVIISLVLMEYWNKPWDFMEFTPEQRQLYAAVERSDVKVILELPMGNLYTTSNIQATNQFIEALYMLFSSTLHSKKLFNGYSSYVPPEYAERIEFLTVNFPTPKKLKQLKEWGVEGIVLHKKWYAHERAYDRIKKELEVLGVNEEASDDGWAFFNLEHWTGAF